MAIVKKEVSSPALGPPAKTGGSGPADPTADMPQLTSSPVVAKDRSIARSVGINNTFGAGWFKDYAQTVPVEEAVKKAFAVAVEIENWITR